MRLVARDRAAGETQELVVPHAVERVEHPPDGRGIELAQQPILLGVAEQLAEDGVRVEELGRRLGPQPDATERVALVDPPQRAVLDADEEVLQVRVVVADDEVEDRLAAQLVELLGCHAERGGARDAGEELLGQAGERLGQAARLDDRGDRASAGCLDGHDAQAQLGRDGGRTDLGLSRGRGLEQPPLAGLVGAQLLAGGRARHLGQRDVDELALGLDGQLGDLGQDARRRDPGVRYQLQVDHVERPAVGGGLVYHSPDAEARAAREQDLGLVVVLGGRGRHRETAVTIGQVDAVDHAWISGLARELLGDRGIERRRPERIVREGVADARQPALDLGHAPIEHEPVALAAVDVQLGQRSGCDQRVERGDLRLDLRKRQVALGIERAVAQEVVDVAIAVDGVLLDGLDLRPRVRRGEADLDGGADRVELRHRDVRQAAWWRKLGQRERRMDGRWYAAGGVSLRAQRVEPLLHAWISRRAVDLEPQAQSIRFAGEVVHRREGQLGVERGEPFEGVPDLEADRVRGLVPRRVVGAAVQLVPREAHGLHISLDTLEPDERVVELLGVELGWQDASEPGVRVMLDVVDQVTPSERRALDRDPALDRVGHVAAPVERLVISERIAAAHHAQLRAEGRDAHGPEAGSRFLDPDVETVAGGGLLEAEVFEPFAHVAERARARDGVGADLGRDVVLQHAAAPAAAARVTRPGEDAVAAQDRGVERRRVRQAHAVDAVVRRVEAPPHERRVARDRARERVQLADVAERADAIPDGRDLLAELAEG
jgi:hypothetical protein